MKIIGKTLLGLGAFISLSLIAIIILFIAYEGLLFYKYDFDPNYALIDRCLDLDHEWDYTQETCSGDTVNDNQ